MTTRSNSLQSRVASLGAMGLHTYGRQARSWYPGPLADLFRRLPRIGDHLARSAHHAHSSYLPSINPCIVYHLASSNCLLQKFHCQRMSPRNNCPQGRQASPCHASSLSRTLRCTWHHRASVPHPDRVARLHTTSPHIQPRWHVCTCPSREPCHSTTRLRIGPHPHDKASRNRKHDRACSSPRSGFHLATAEPQSHHEETLTIHPCRFRHWEG